MATQHNHDKLEKLWMKTQESLQAEATVMPQEFLEKHFPKEQNLEDVPKGGKTADVCQ